MLIVFLGGVFHVLDAPQGNWRALRKGYGLDIFGESCSNILQVKPRVVVVSNQAN